jgi:hypothetical protein
VEGVSGGIYVWREFFPPRFHFNLVSCVPSTGRRRDAGFHPQTDSPTPRAPHVPMPSGFVSQLVYLVSKKTVLFGRKISVHLNLS